MALSVVYVVVWLIAGSSLTFYYDDYFLILSQHDRSFLGSLATGLNGNWWPLATLVQRVEVWLFGPWYAGYLGVNALLCISIAWLSWFTVRPLAGRRPWLLFAALTLYACSLGVLVNVSVLTASWPLSVALAMLAAFLLTHRKRWIWLWVVVLVLCLLADSGLFAINASIIAATFIASRIDQRAARLLPSLRELTLAVTLIVSGVIGTVLGNVVATRNPIDYYGGNVVETTSLLQPFSVVEVARATFSFAVPWLASPLVPFSAIRNAFLTWQVVLVNTYLLLFAVFAASALALIAVVVTRSRDRSFHTFLIALVFAIPVIETSAILAVTRSGGAYAPRYALVWLLPAALGWAVVLSRPVRTALIRAVISLGRAALVVSAGVALVLLPVTTRDAIDTDKARWENTGNQLAQMRACLDGEEATPVPAVSPGIGSDDFCRFVRYVRTSSLLGSLLE